MAFLYPILHLQFDSILYREFCLKFHMLYNTDRCKSGHKNHTYPTTVLQWNISIFVLCTVLSDTHLVLMSLMSVQQKSVTKEKKAQCALKRQWICGYIDCWFKTHSLENIFSSPVATPTSWEPLFGQKGEKRCQSTCKMCIHV